MWKLRRIEATKVQTERGVCILEIRNRQDLGHNSKRFCLLIAGGAGRLLGKELGWVKNEENVIGGLGLGASNSRLGNCPSGRGGLAGCGRYRYSEDILLVSL
jgi:hypothetical protein